MLSTSQLYYSKTETSIMTLGPKNKKSEQSYNKFKKSNELWSEP